MDNLTENLQGTANAAEAEKEEVAADLGKFKDVKALLSAYNSLEAEFTRRSQRLKELEEKSKSQEGPASAASPYATSEAQNFSDEQALYDAASANAAVKERIIGEYIRTVSQRRGVPLVTGGISVPSPKNRPATVKDAGKLAEEFLTES